MAGGLDKAKARYWYNKAIENGNVSAYANLALLYKAEGDFVKAQDLLLKAIDLGDGDAALELAKLYLDSTTEAEPGEIADCLEEVVRSKSVTPSSVSEATELRKKIKL